MISFGLTAKATFSYNYTNSRFDGYQYAYQIYTYDKEKDTYNGTPAVGRWRSQIDRSVPARYMQLQLNYAKQIKNHNISAVLGYEASDYDWTKKTYGTEPSTDYLPLLQFDELNSFGDEWSYEARAGWIGNVSITILLINIWSNYWLVMMVLIFMQRIIVGDSSRVYLSVGESRKRNSLKS